MAFGLSATALSLISAAAPTVIGGLLGGASSSSGGGLAKTESKEPWAPAAPWLKSQIERGQQLQQHYADNPFNDQQKTAYENTFGDLNNFRSNVAPGLSQFANSMMTGPGYQRQQLERPGQGGYGQRQPMQNQGPGGLMQGPFSVPQGGLMGHQYSPVDFNAQKPPPQAAPPQVDPMEDMRRQLAEQEAQRNLTSYDSRGG